MIFIHDLLELTLPGYSALHNQEHLFDPVELVNRIFAFQHLDICIACFSFQF